MKRTPEQQMKIKQKRGTTITFTGEELLELAKFVSAGTVLLQVKPKVASRIKTGLSRLGLHVPAGL